jgi:hypothetical protein
VGVLEWSKNIASSASRIVNPYFRALGQQSVRILADTLVRDLIVSTFEIEKLIEAIRSRHGQRTSKRIPLALAREQGRDLIALKAACPHGEFRRLVEARLPFRYSVASDFMKIARKLGKVGRRSARDSLSVRQALSLIERPQQNGLPVKLSNRARAKLAEIGTKSPSEADQCRLIEGDCLKELVDISDHSADLILCDLPFGNSGYGWDHPIDLAALWQHFRRVIKPNNAIVLVASQPFARPSTRASPSVECLTTRRDWSPMIGTRSSASLGGNRLLVTGQAVRNLTYANSPGTRIQYSDFLSMNSACIRPPSR